MVGGRRPKKASAASSGPRISILHTRYNVDDLDCTCTCTCTLCRIQLHRLYSSSQQPLQPVPLSCAVRSRRSYRWRWSDASVICVHILSLGQLLVSCLSCRLYTHSTVLYCTVQYMAANLPTYLPTYHQLRAALLYASPPAATRRARIRESPELDGLAEAILEAFPPSSSNDMRA